MASADPVEVIRVVQIVEIQPKVNVVVDWIGRHSFHRPVTIHKACVRIVAVAFADKARPAVADTFFAGLELR